MKRTQEQAPASSNREAGFSIVESLVVMAIIIIVTAFISNYFLGSKDLAAYRASRVSFEEEISRVLMVTEEHVVCDELNFVGNVTMGTAPKQVLANLSELKLGNSVIMKVGKNKRYGISKIELIQESVRFGQNPQRALAEIVVTGEFFDSKGKVTSLLQNDSAKVKSINLVIASDSGGKIDSCYGTFSRKISCIDLNGSYNPKGKPNCVK